MDALQSIGIFAAQTFLILFAIIAVIVVIALFAAKAGHKPEVQIELVHKKYKRFRNTLRAQTLTKSERKDLKKKLKEETKASEEKSRSDEKKIYLIDFDGDIKATAADNLREEITAVLTVATPHDEIVVRIESPGGVVHGYGLAAAQLIRVREKNIPLTVCVDKVAASGGYMMSCTANKILSAPFAIVGSIGVVAQVPNLYRLLRNTMWTIRNTLPETTNAPSASWVKSLLKAKRNLNNNLKTPMCFSKVGFRSTGRT